MTQDCVVIDPPCRWSAALASPISSEGRGGVEQGRGVVWGAEREGEGNK